MNNRFDVIDLPLKNLKIIQRKPIMDDRGYLERLFCKQDLSKLINGKSIEQVNYTMTALRGTVRGMHFQAMPFTEIKFVSCLRGEIFDVVVDLRAGSPTFLHHHAEILSEDNRKMFVIPEGFAHGFQTLTDQCEILYFHTSIYQPGSDCGLNPFDPRLAIKWPFALSKISERDANHPMLTKDFNGVTL